MEYSSPENRNRYKGIKNKVNSRVQENKEEYWQTFSRDIGAEIYGSQKRTWKRLRGMKRETNESKQLGVITEKTWEQYFVELYTYMKITLQQQ